jgi:hypothetical protein
VEPAAQGGFFVACATEPHRTDEQKPRIDGSINPEGIPMCEYSLHNVASRPARIADELVTTEFAGTMTRGFAAVGEHNVAVCLRPGTELVFEKDVVKGHPLDRLLPWLKLGHIGGRSARFRNVNLNEPNMHRDALEFADGQIVMLTSLMPGQRAAVLQLPPETRGAKTEERVTESASLV